MKSNRAVRDTSLEERNKYPADNGGDHNARPFTSERTEVRDAKSEDAWKHNGIEKTDSHHRDHRYRMNVCRRRLALDLARVLDGAPAQETLEDHHDRPPGSHNAAGGVYSLG
jgi:hypothetical protein